MGSWPILTDKTIVSHIALRQSVFVLLASVGVMLAFSFTAAVSFALGGAICILPTLLFGRIFFKYGGARAARNIINAFYIGEGIKLLLTAALFALLFQFQVVASIWVFLGYLFAQFVVLFLSLNVGRGELI